MHNNNLRGVAQLGSAPALGAKCATLVFHDSQVKSKESSTNPEYVFQNIHGVRVRQRAHERAHFSDEGRGFGLSPLSFQEYLVDMNATAAHKSP